MKARRPVLDFSTTPAHWAPNHEYAQSCNSSSLWIPYLERFLNRVLAKALSRLKESGKLGEELRADVRMFIRQESNHYALHDEYNAILTRSGYDVARFEAMFEAEFEKLFQSKSIAFLTAYCEGFESLGPPAALTWLDESEDLLKGARPEVAALWKWHLMEEFEHRAVCHDVYHAVHGGYFLRIYAFLYQLRQLQSFSRMVRSYLLEVDREGMSPEERQASIEREKAVDRRTKRHMLPRLLKVFSPFYSPRNAPEPQMYRQYMAQVEAALQ